MKNLQNSVNKLIALWDKVEESLIEEFANLEQEVGGNQIVHFDTFEEILDTFCGPRKVLEERKHRRATHHKWLTAEDINFIANRFEIGDRIDVKQFFNFFQDAFYSDDSQPLAAATPFQFSQEWSTLKKSAQEDLVPPKKKKTKKVIEPVEDEDDESKYDEEKSIEPEPEPEPPTKLIKPKASRSPSKEKPIAKPALTKEKSVKKNPVEEKPKKAAAAKSAPLQLERKRQTPSPPAKIFNNTLVALYASDPDSFENKLETMASATGFIMTKDEFRIVLQDHTANDNIADDEIDDVLNHLKYIGGTCSVTDLVEYLATSVETAETAPTSSSEMDKPSTRGKNASIGADVAYGPFVNVRQQHIVDTIEKLKVAKLDAITTKHDENPKEFVASLKASSINNKTGIVDGTGNSVTSASFNQLIRGLVPESTKKEVNTLESELQSSIRKDTNDILLSAVTNKLKARSKEFKATAANIKKQEKLLAIEEKRNVSMDERAARIKELTKQQEQTDSICDHYFMDPTLFMAKLKTGRDPKTLSISDLQQHLNKEVPKITKADNNKLKSDILEANKKLSADDPNAQVPFANVEKILKQRNATKVKLLKQIESEKKLLQKDVDKASTVDDGGGGGCCGGGGGNVHDPNNAPQDLPADLKKEKDSEKDAMKDDMSDVDIFDTEPEEKPTRKRSSSNDEIARADDEPPSDEDEDEDEEKQGEDDEDLPRYKPNISKPRLKNSQTTDTLTFSDCDGMDDGKSDDSGGNGRRLGSGDEKLMHRKPIIRSARGGSQGGSVREFGKPKSFDDSRVPSDGSDDDSLIFQSMKKK